jgi:hypothetical protein
MDGVHVRPPECQTCVYVQVGGVLYVDLLALPPPAKKAKAWTLRQVRGGAAHGCGI